MQLYFIRHAQSTNNAIYTSTGADTGRTADPELTDLGRRQAQRLAEFLTRGDRRGGYDCNTPGEGFGLTHIYTSLMLRAVATAAEIARATGLPLHAWEDIHEEGGLFLEDKATGALVGKAGKNRQYFEENYPGIVLPETLGEQGWWGERPFEAPEARPDRARRFIRDLLRKHGGNDNRVAVVSHGGFFSLFLTLLLNLHKREGYWFTMYNTGIARLDFEPSRPDLTAPIVNLVYANRVDFLPPDLIT